jgi:uncharacterized protein YraI
VAGFVANEAARNAQPERINTMALTFGRVPHPAFEERIATANQAWNDLGPRNIVGTCIHRMDGSLWGTDSYFQLSTTPGLTDYGIGGKLEEDSSDGRILMWNDPRGNRAPHANGEAVGLERNGAPFVNYYEVDAVNRDLVSIELSGHSGLTRDGNEVIIPETDVSPKQFEMLCQLIAHYHDAAHVPWDVFPKHPVSGVVTCLEHWEFATKQCPFSEVRGLRDRYLTRTREIMKHYQTGKTDPLPPGTSLPGSGSTGTPNSGQPANFRVNDKIAVAVTGPINLRAGTSTSTNAVTSMANGTQLCVLGGPTANESYRWYRVRIISTGQIGYVAGELCSVVARAGCGTGSPAARFAVNDRIRVADGPLNVRSGASSSHPILGELTLDTELCVVQGPTFASGYEWYRVNGFGLLGWVAGEFCSLVSSGGCSGGGAGGRFAVNDKVEVVDGPLNLRAQPSSAAAILNVYSTGTELCLASGPSYADGYEWYQVAGGWIAGDFCALITPGGCGPAVPTGRFATWDRIYVADGPLNVRTGPTVAAAISAELVEGTEACVRNGPKLADGYEWYGVTVNGIEGWVAGDFCGLMTPGGCRTTSTTSRFSTGDKIEVIDGPLNVRNGPALAATTIGSYETWASACVMSGPVYADGYDWYQVDGLGLQGWVAGNYWGLLATGGCMFSAASLTTRIAPIPPSGVWLGEFLTVVEGPVLLRAAASAAATVIASLPADRLGVVVSAPITAEGHVWHQIDTRQGRGWAQAADLAKKRPLTNRLANSTADTDLANISAQNSGSTIYRELVDSSYAVKCVNSGTETGQGLRYSGVTLSLAGLRRFVGVVDVFGSGVIDGTKVRIMYADGSASTFSASAPSVSLSSSAWKRVVTPIVESDSTKVVSRVELWVRRNSAVAQTFFADNAKVVSI